MTLHGRLLDVADGQVVFDGDLERNLDAADDVYNGINTMIDRFVEEHGLETTAGPSQYHAVWRPYGYRGSRVAADELAAVVWATGFTRDYRWLHAPVFDGAGHPAHVRGVTPVAGLYFVGLPWQHTWGSGRFAGLDRDAAFVAEHLRTAVASPEPTGVTV